MTGQLLTNKKGGDSPASGAGAALLVFIIAALLILYVAFLPEDESQDLLDNNQVPGTPPSSSSGYSHLEGTSALRGNIGEISAIEKGEIEHELNSFRLHTTSESSVLSRTPRTTIKNSAFQQKTHTIEFSIDPSTTSDIFLSYNVLFGDGELKVHFNGVPVYEHEKERGSISPIRLPRHLFKNENVIHLSVSTPGLAFWSTNLYKLENIMVTANIEDESDSLNAQMFHMSDKELEYFDKATLSFYPDCDEKDVGPIDIKINDKSFFHGIPDCHMKNFITVPKDRLQDGENNISFVTASGEYIIDQLKLDVELDDVEHPIYYFDLDEDLFRFIKEDNPHCGNIDGECPDNCEPYEDKDCCFEESNSNYWCDVRTDNPRDRCVNMVLAQHTNRCPSGYEDPSGEPHPEVDGECGDDTDGYCPQGCDVKHDKDCCYEDNPDNYWCGDVPFTGMDGICTPYVTLADCNACPDGYEDEDGKRPNCPSQDDSINYEEEPQLKAGVDVLLRVDFADREYKDVDFIINGKELPVATYNRAVTRSIDNMVHYGTNSIIIKPNRDVTISQIDVRIE